MPRMLNSPPKYRKHKASGQAIVTLNGRDYYLGPHGTAASKHEYDRLVAEWLAHGRTIQQNADGITVVELLAQYIKWAVDYYRESNEADHIKAALRPLRELYGRTPAAEFGPLKLKAVREKLVGLKVTRSGINKRIGRMKRVFRWAVENELVPSSVYHGLQAVRGLGRGRTEAPESEPVRPVPEAFVQAVLPVVLPPVRAMIELQLATGMRPGEVVAMTTAALDMSGKVWFYKPAKHKQSHRGHERTIYIGPRGQAILRPWLKTDLQAPLFSPREAIEARRAERHANRKTPLSCGNRPGSNRVKMRQRHLHETYSVNAYRHAIKAGCRKAGVPEWSPHQLRHNAGTRLRKEFGLDTSRVILGHRSPAVTAIYAEADESKAILAIGQVG